MEILRDLDTRVPKREVHAEVGRRLDLTDAELTPGRDGVPRWVTYLGYHTSAAASVGFVVKIDAHWSITEAGRAALELHPSAEEVFAHTWRRYHEILAGRQRSHQRHEVSLAAIADALDRVPRGAWTAFEDLATLSGATVSEVAELLVVGDALPTVYRVLTIDGEVPVPAMVHPIHRGEDQRGRLIAEGVEFYGVRANPDQHVPLEILRATFADPATGRRAWLVRPTSGDPADVVARWLDAGSVSVPASLLTPLEPETTTAALRRAVGAAYPHMSYPVRERLESDLNAFVRRMRPGDLVLAATGWLDAGDPGTVQVHLGLVDGPPTHAESEHGAALRRPVRWLTLSRPLRITDLSGPLPVLMQTQADVVDLTGALASVELLLDRVERGLDRANARPAPPAPAVLPSPPGPLAGELLLDEVWLSGVVDLLRQRHQIVLFGPPGTGKTHLAMCLAQRLVPPNAATVVQLHAGYTYADFVEGFRPEATEDGPERMRLRAGPLRRLADEAREQPGIPYLLIIDEVNRGDLASVLGEVSFLLEYRDRPISLPNSQDTNFTLPNNLYVIGTMNPDRAAPLDPGLRRRFAFVEMHPSKPPVAGLLRRWLDRHGFDQTAADLLDRLNELLAASNDVIGPSYLMREEAHTRPDGLELVWRHDILPLLAERHRGDGSDVAQRYGLAGLRASLTQRPVRP